MTVDKVDSVNENYIVFWVDFEICNPMLPVFRMKQNVQSIVTKFQPKWQIIFFFCQPSNGDISLSFQIIYENTFQVKCAVLSKLV